MRTHRRRLAPLALSSALLLSSACTNAEKDEPAATKPAGSDSTTPSKPAPKPAEPLPAVSQPTTDSAPVAAAQGVVASVHIPSGTSMTDLAAALDNLKPGTSALLKMQAPSSISQALGMDLAGANLSGPLSLVVLDPVAYPKPFALLVEVENLDVLTTNAKNAGTEIRHRDGKALLGSADVVAAAESFAFDNLAQALDHSEIVIYPRPLLAALKPQIDEGLAAMRAQLSTSAAGPNAAQFIDVYIQGITAMAEQTDRIVISVGASTSSTDLFMRMYPSKGSSLEAFAQAQVPGDHSLLAKLPAGAEPPALMSGTMRAGGARDALLAWTVVFMRSMYQSELSVEEWAKVLGTWIDTFDGNFSVTMDMNLSGLAGGQAAPAPAIRMTGLLGSTDPAAMRTAWREMIAGMTTNPGGATEMMGMRFTMSTQPDALEHDGVGVDLFRSTVDFTSLPPEQQAALKATGSADQALHFATFDTFGAMATADTDGASIRGVIDSARGKGTTYTPTPAIKAAIDSSVQNGESLVYYIDFAKMMASSPTPVPADMPFAAIVMGMGRRGDALSMRISLLK
jgi:hypothetical protein